MLAPSGYPARDPLCLLSVAARAPWLALTSGAPKARADAESSADLRARRIIISGVREALEILRHETEAEDGVTDHGHAGRDQQRPPGRWVTAAAG